MQKNLDLYLSQLIDKSKTLQDYDISKLNLSHFDLINLFLLNNVLFSKDQNIFIKLPGKETQINFYIPTLLSVAVVLFLNNYTDYNPEYKIGDDVFLKKNDI